MVRTEMWYFPREVDEFVMALSPSAHGSHSFFLLVLIILYLGLLKGMIQQSILSQMLGQLHVLVP